MYALRFLILAVLLLPSSAFAEPLPRSFQLDAVSECFSKDDLHDAIAGALGTDPTSSVSADKIEVRTLVGASKARARWVAWRGGEPVRERSIVAFDCASLLRELTLSIVIAYETTEPDRECGAACRESIRTQIRAELLRELKMDLRPLIFAGGLFSAGHTADPSGGVVLGGEIRFAEPFSAGLEARVLFPARAEQTPSKESFDLSVVSFGLVPCFRHSFFMGCAAVDFGMLIGGGVTAASGLPVIATLGVGPRAGVHFGFLDHFGVRVFADLRFSPVQSRIDFAGGGRWESPIVSGLFGAAFSFE